MAGKGAVIPRWGKVVYWSGFRTLPGDWEVLAGRLNGGGYGDEVEAGIG